MPQFGSRSIKVRKDLHPDLIRVMDAAILEVDFIMIQGSRTKMEQEQDFQKGVTRAHWLQSPHDYDPSFAVDIAPLPLQWTNLLAFRRLADTVLRCASRVQIPVTWGGTWHSMTDMPHFELKDWRERAGLHERIITDV